MKYNVIYISLAIALLSPALVSAAPIDRDVDINADHVDVPGSVYIDSNGIRIGGDEDQTTPDVSPTDNATELAATEQDLSVSDQQDGAAEGRTDLDDVLNAADDSPLTTLGEGSSAMTRRSEVVAEDAIDAENLEEGTTDQDMSVEKKQADVVQDQTDPEAALDESESTSSTELDAEKKQVDVAKDQTDREAARDESEPAPSTVDQDRGAEKNTAAVAKDQTDTDASLDDNEPATSTTDDDRSVMDKRSDAEELEDVSATTGGADIPAAGNESVNSAPLSSDQEPLDSSSEVTTDIDESMDIMADKDSRLAN